MMNVEIEIPKVSICCLVYNHQDYLEEALDSFLMQQTNFAFEIVIHDDASTDSSPDIIKEYASKYPEIFNPLYQTINQKSIFKSGMNPRFNFPRAKGKYIAICEGDDYWTDPLKLQKQVDFLENNSNYGICFHTVNQKNMFDNCERSIPNIRKDTIYSVSDYITNNKTATCSIVFNKTNLAHLPNWFEKVPFGDLAIILLVLINSNSKGFVLKDVMGVYRIHGKSVHGKFHKNNKGLIKAYKQHIEFFKIVTPEILSESKYKKAVYKKYKNTYNMLSKLYKQNNEIFNFLRASFFCFYYKLILKLI